MFLVWLGTRGSSSALDLSRLVAPWATSATTLSSSPFAAPLPGVRLQATSLLTNSIHVSPPECFRYSISEVDMRKHTARRTALPVASHFMHSRHRICRSRKRLAHREHVLYSTGNRAAMPLRTAGRGSLTSAVPRGPQLPCTQPEYWHKKRPGQQPRQTTRRCSCSSSSQDGRVRPH